MVDKILVPVPDQKARTPQVLNRTVQNLPKVDESQQPLSDFVLGFASAADEIPRWGSNVAARDAQLRAFWHTESYLASAIYSTCIRNAGFEFTLEGPPRTVRQVQKHIFDLADMGRGWFHFIIKFCIDLLTQDNGGFIEIIRSGNKPTSPVVGIAHLDAHRCQRTGDPDFPVIYTDRFGARHKLAYYQVQPVEEFPSPVETMYGAQFCSVTRVLRAAQVLKEIAIYKHEKVSGRFHRSIHIVSGVSARQVDDAMQQHSEQADNRGMIRYIQPLILGSLDPTANVGHTQIDMASLPDAFDEETTLKWYIAQLALGLGNDYQDFAPLPGGNLGTAQQSEILHRKTRGKGPALFMELIEHIFNTFILPDTVTMSYSEQDIEAAQDIARLKGIRAKERAERLKSGELTPTVARMIALDEEDLTEEQFAQLAKEQKETEEIRNRENLTEEQLEPSREDDPSMEREIENA